MRKLFITLFILLLSFGAVQAQITIPFIPLSPLRVRIPDDAVYTREGRIGSFRGTGYEWGSTVCRTNPGDVIPLVTVTVIDGGRTGQWAIPRSCNPTSSADAAMDIINVDAGYIYEVAAAAWVDNTHIRAVGAVAFLISGNGITPVGNQVTSASGICVICFMPIREDIADLQAGYVPHAYTAALPASLLDGSSSGFVYPATHPETQGQRNCSSCIPMGARFAVPRTLTDAQIDAMNIHPLTRILLKSMRDYGIYIDDGNGAANYQDLATGTIRFEQGVTETVYGVSSEILQSRVQAEMFTVLQNVGLYRVTGGTISTGTPAPLTSTPPATSTVRPAFTPTIRPSSTLGFTPIFTATPVVTGTPIGTPFGTPYTLGCSVFPHELRCPLP